MALSTKKYLYIFFLVSPILSLYAQSSTEKPTASVGSHCKPATVIELNQNNESAVNANSKIDNSNQFIVGLSTPKDNLTIATETNNQFTDCNENSLISSTSILAKDIIENYKYDFSETFIDILFFERIDLARTRTI